MQKKGSNLSTFNSLFRRSIIGHLYQFSESHMFRYTKQTETKINAPETWASRCETCSAPGTATAKMSSQTATCRNRLSGPQSRRTPRRHFCASPGDSCRICCCHCRCRCDCCCCCCCCCYCCWWGRRRRRFWCCSRLGWWPTGTD